MNERDLEIGKKIKQYRKEGKMTQQELAAKIGKTESSIRKYEKGLVSIPLDVIEEIASALDINAFHLMGIEYWKKKYPDIAKENEEYESFIAYLNSLGYTVKDISIPCQIPIEQIEKMGKMDLVSKECKEASFVIGETHSIELIKNGKSILLKEHDFEKLQTEIKEAIAFKLWQKGQEKT